MGDLISRKALVETIVNTSSEVRGYNPVYLTGCATRQNEILDMIERMPSFKPPKGEWQVSDSFDMSGQIVRCSVCGARDFVSNQALLEITDVKMHNFCPNCGADMQSRKKVTE